MKKNLTPLEAAVIVLGTLVNAFFLLVIVVAIIGPEPSRRKSRNKERNETALVKTRKTEPAQTVPRKEATEADYIAHFQAEWDSVKLERDEWSYAPKYGKYTDDLGNINERMKALIDGNPGNFKELEKLRMKFVESKKWKDADRDWLTYGEPKMEYDLVAPCEAYLLALDIEGYRREKTVANRTKKGWEVKIKYSGLNMFNARVREVMTFDVRFNAVDNSYYVKSVR